MHKLPIVTVILGAFICLSGLAIAQLDPNWRQQIEWAARLLAGANLCGFPNPGQSSPEARNAIRTRYARAVGKYMKEHTPPREAMDYYPQAYVSPWHEMKEKGVNCDEIRSHMENFIRKYGYPEDKR